MAGTRLQLRKHSRQKKKYLSKKQTLRAATTVNCYNVKMTDRDQYFVFQQKNVEETSEKNVSFHGKFLKRFVKIMLGTGTCSGLKRKTVDPQLRENPPNVFVYNFLLPHAWF
jgi:hypothetical protein